MKYTFKWATTFSVSVAAQISDSAVLKATNFWSLENHEIGSPFKKNKFPEELRRVTMSSPNDTSVNTLNRSFSLLFQSNGWQPASQTVAVFFSDENSLQGDSVYKKAGFS